MRRVAAIATLALRQAVRSRVLLVLMLLLSATAMGLPLTLRGDGTLEGHVRLFLSYTLGLSQILLSLSAVWAGCAAVSSEVRDRSLHLVMTKPVRSWELWLGKWIGLTALHGGLLVFSCGMISALLLWTTRPVALSDEDRQRLMAQILVARESVRPVEDEVIAAARADWEERQRAGTLPADADPEDAFEALVRAYRLQFYGVAPGTMRVWAFRLPRTPDATRPIHVQFRFSKSALDLEAVTGQWFWGGREGTERRIEGSWIPEAVHTLELPAGALGEAREFRLAFGNTDPSGATVFFDPDQGIQLLYHRGSFGGNLMRSALVLAVQLGFLTALGLTAGALFSMPVAAFTSVSMLLILQMSDYVGQMAKQPRILGDLPGAPPILRAVDPLLRLFYRGLRGVVSPLQVPDVLDRLAGGRLVDWGLVASVTATHLLLYGVILALIGAGLLRRRELGAAA